VTNKKILYSTLAFVLYVAFLSLAFAGYRIWSEQQEVTVTTFLLTMNELPTSIEQTHSLIITGKLTKDTIPISGATILIFINEAQISSCLTDELGDYSYEHLVTEAEGMTLYVKTGYDVP